MSPHEDERRGRFSASSGNGGLRASITRRSFLAAAGVSASLLAVGGVGALTAHGEMLRPPGGQDERALLAGCTHCGRCVSACRTKAIGVASISDGLLEARTPVMRYSLGFCDFCGDCAEACPTGALRAFDVEAAQAGDVSACCVGKAKLDRATCLAWTSSSCNLCHEECPYDAIALNADGMPIVDEALCNGCGVCEYVCPVLSLRSYIGGTARAIAVEPVRAKEGEVS
ncbi:hypothetical protein B5F40_01175 [Gordonibacter sp. An230]|uniref:4Fe-4S dicluster domain-containing protein n=1 Tax=Gordonibacter sp. An230 TaxID=1965592 RepID=UPI000B3A2ACB|nr:4Fe-4S dicluster domain-containing protein [Gordonibacter sp. An230]OUO92533.1 hypothetical protein B5F40_01175 [Gordonibacter sp. An230]